VNFLDKLIGSIIKVSFSTHGNYYEKEGKLLAVTSTVVYINGAKTVPALLLLTERAGASRIEVVGLVEKDYDITAIVEEFSYE
jgi:hypothetical protein